MASPKTIEMTLRMFSRLLDELEKVVVIQRYIVQFENATRLDMQKYTKLI
ncbi:MAG: hypothetical protein H6Q74_234 [Firmicutes bacterium]|nr:hypothetical protein [Bacillota bacterium]